MRYVLSGVLFIGLLVITLVNAATGASADEPVDPFGSVDTVEMIFYPFVPNGEMLDGTGPWHGSITVQNIEQHDVRIWASTDAEFDPDAALGTFLLPPNGAVTLSIAQLGLDAPGGPVVIAGMFRSVWEAGEDGIDHALEATCGLPPLGSDGDIWRETCKPALAGVARMVAPGPMSGSTGNRTDGSHLIVDGYNAVTAQDVAWGSQSDFCQAIVSRWSDECSGIGTYEPFGHGVGFVFDGHSYLPIVQTNSGWNTVLHISNVDPSAGSSQVNLTLIAGDQQGFAAGDEHKTAFERVLQPGETWTLDLKQAGLPDEWVGSAHITSSVGVVATASRIKPETDMLMTNVSVPSIWATTSRGTELQYQAADEGHQLQTVGTAGFEMYGPLVFMDFNGWNTGISIANIAEATNVVTASFYGPAGNVVAADHLTITAQGQQFIHMPALPDIDQGTGWVGSVVLSAPYEFHATIDQVKYSTGEAMTYLATAAGARFEPSGDPWPDAGTLAMPLFQKGQLDGSGDYSGLQLFNASTAGPVDIEVVFRSQIGNAIAPTRDEPYRVTIPPLGNHTLYSGSLSEMPPNTAGTVVVTVTGGEGQLVGVANTVNYSIEGDGSTAFNLVNTFGQYRLPVSQTE